MFTNLSFDELNALVKNERSMSFKKYFGEMNLPEDIETIIAFAIGCGVDWICLDSDGPIENGFKTYEW